MTGTKPTVVNNATVTAPQLARADRPSSRATVVGSGVAGALVGGIAGACSPAVGAGVGTAVGFVVQQVAD